MFEMIVIHSDKNGHLTAKSFLFVVLKQKRFQNVNLPM